MTYKEFLHSSPKDMEHVLKAKKVLPVDTYTLLWNIACKSFLDGLKADIPEHQRLNFARRSANQVFTKAMRN